MYVCVCGVCARVHVCECERKRKRSITNFLWLQKFHEFEAQIKAIYMYVKFSPIKSLATHKQTCIWEA